VLYQSDYVRKILVGIVSAKDINREGSWPLIVAGES